MQDGFDAPDVRFHPRKEDIHIWKPNRIHTQVRRSMDWREHKGIYSSPPTKEKIIYLPLMVSFPSNASYAYMAPSQWLFAGSSKPGDPEWTDPLWRIKQRTQLWRGFDVWEHDSGWRHGPFICMIYVYLWKMENTWLWLRWKDFQTENRLNQNSCLAS